LSEGEENQILQERSQTMRANLRHLHNRYICCSTPEKCFSISPTNLLEEEIFSLLVRFDFAIENLDYTHHGDGVRELQAIYEP
jgi:hypothetical protein